MKSALFQSRPMKWMPPCPAVLLLSMCTVASTVFGASISLNPSQDTSIYSESDNSNATGGLFAGDTANATVRRALFKFDLASSGIPAGSIINSVSLTLTQTKIGPAVSALFELHALSAAWGEGSSIGTGAGGASTPGDATWNFRLYDTSSWTTAGGDFGTSSGTTTFGASLGSYTFATQPGLVADVQSWLTTPGTNFGWLLKASNESATSARQLGSRESSLSQQPTLTITYTTVPEPGGLALLAVGAVYVGSRRRPTHLARFELHVDG